jgi:hypothetical protein
MSQATVHVGRPAMPASIAGKILLAIALLTGLGFVIGFVFPYLTLSQQRFGGYWEKRAWLLLHIVPGAFALILGPFVLSMGLARRRMKLHRKLGYGYMTSIGLSSIGAFYLAFHTDVNWMFGAGLAGLGIAWLITTSLALAAIRRRLVAQHKEWMIRSYVVTFGFVNFRILVRVLTATGVGTLVERLTVSSWFCWAFPLLVTEAILQSRKIFGSQAA